MLYMLPKTCVKCNTDKYLKLCVKCNSLFCAVCIHKKNEIDMCIQCILDNE